MSSWHYLRAAARFIRFISFQFMLSFLITVVFAFLMSGFVFCLITNMPGIGYSRSENHEIGLSPIDLNTVTGQFFFEAWLISVPTIGLVSSLFAVYALLSNPTLGKWAIICLRTLSLSFPIWVYFIDFVFKEKQNGYSLGWKPVWATLPRRHSF
jgi:hypothetical protein